MASTDVPPEFIANSLALHLLTSEVLDSVARFELPETVESQVRAIGAQVHGEPKKRSLARLRPSRPNGVDWLERLSRGFESTNEGLAASHFHYRRIREIEEKIREACMSHAEAFRVLNPHGTFGFGSRPLSFEYAAFTFAVRRTLDYLAICIGSYFKTQSYSIRRVADAIDGQFPATARKRVQRRLRPQRLVALIGDPSANRKSVRDELAHYRAIDSGVFNVRWDHESQGLQIVLVGGGEDLPAFPEEPRNLSEVLAEQLGSAEDLIFGCFRDIGLSPTN
jgi:hypothetical protein